MKRFILSISIVLFLLLTAAAQNNFAQSAPYTPAKGSAERKAILDGVRKYRKVLNEVYMPREFKVQNGWSFVSADDPNEPGVDTAAFDVLLRKTGKVWKVMDEVSHAEGADWRREIGRIRKKFPKAPSGIFP